MTKPTFKFALREDLKDDKQFLPKRAHETDTGWDVCAAMPDRKDLIIIPNDYVKIPLGFRAFCPPGWWYSIKPRSSTFAKKYLHALYGTVDEAFEGEMVFSCNYIPPHNENHGCPRNLIIKFGEAIAQIIPVRRKEMETVEISNEEYDFLAKERQGGRGAGGFGSTDNKGK